MRLEREMRRWGKSEIERTTVLLYLSERKQAFSWMGWDCRDATQPCDFMFPPSLQFDRDGTAMNDLSLKVPGLVLSS